MKKVILVICCFSLINSTDCFSQSFKKNKNEIYTKMRYVYGHSADFKESLYLGITFGKFISSMDTNFYIKLKLDAPTTEYRTDMHFNKASSITFLAKNGKSVDLKMSDAGSLIKSDNLTPDTYSPIKMENYSTYLIFNVTKEKLTEIGSEPFYRIILPYYNSSSEVNNEIVFINPTLFIRRTFIQKNIKYILDN